MMKRFGKIDISVRYISLLLVFFLPSDAAGAGASPSDLDVQGHRGCRGLRPENTMAAFEKAIELGVTTIELDVLLTRDGTLVARLRQSPCTGVPPPDPGTRGTNPKARGGSRSGCRRALPGSRQHRDQATDREDATVFGRVCCAARRPFAGEGPRRASHHPEQM